MQRSNERFGKPVEGYIPGFNRGATGFNTRADIGPMQLGTDISQLLKQPGNFGAPPTGYVAGAGRSSLAATREPDIDRGDYSDAHYDKWNGYEGSLFSNAEFSKDDDDADITYKEIDEYMDGRRKRHREKRIVAEIEKARKENPTIRSIFQDLKRNLSKVTKEEWESIPDIVDRTVKKKKYDRKAPIPDNIILSALKDMETTTAVEDIALGNESVVPGNMTEVSRAKGAALSISLQNASSIYQNPNEINKEGYLTELSNVGITDIQNMKKAKVLTKNLVQTNPNKASAWLGAARVEELDGKIDIAKSLIIQGTMHCPDSDDLWIEAARLHPSDEARKLIAKGLQQIPKSIKLWKVAVNYEVEKERKLELLKKALEFNSNSEELWKQAIELEDKEKAKALLTKAVECIPTSSDLWIALAKLENYDAAKVILNRAGKANPGNYMIWIHACKLEESKGNNNNIEIILGKALQILPKHGCNMKREMWIKAAQECELALYPKTAQAIIKLTMVMDLDVNERRAVWTEDAKKLVDGGTPNCARTVIQEALQHFPKSKPLWLNAYEIEKDHGTIESQEAIFKNIIQALPTDPLFHLMYAKHQWQIGLHDKCRSILKNAREQLPSSIDVWVAAIKFEREAKAFSDALLLCKQCKVAEPRVLKHCIQIKRKIGSKSEEIMHDIDSGIEQFPKYHKLYKIGCEIMEEIKSFDKARTYVTNGVVQCQKTDKCSDMFIYACNFERRQNDVPKARTIMQEAKIYSPKDPAIWYESIQLEISSGNLKIAKSLISRALQECPKNGLLWALAIDNEQLSQQKAKCQDAIKYCEDDEHVMLSGAKIFLKENKLEKAKKWISRSVLLNPQFGDGWGYYYYIANVGNEKELVADIVASVKKVKPNKGSIWRSVSKSICNMGIGSLEILKKVVDIISSSMPSV